MKIKELNLTCNILHIVGIPLMVLMTRLPNPIYVLNVVVGISGFAAIVRALITDHDDLNYFVIKLTGFTGVFMIFVAMLHTVLI